MHTAINYMFKVRWDSYVEDLFNKLIERPRLYNV